MVSGDSTCKAVGGDDPLFRGAASVGMGTQKNDPESGRKLPDHKRKKGILAQSALAVGIQGIENEKRQYILSGKV